MLVTNPSWPPPQAASVNFQTQFCISKGISNTGIHHTITHIYPSHVCWPKSESCHSTETPACKVSS